MKCATSRKCNAPKRTNKVWQPYEFSHPPPPTPAPTPPPTPPPTYPTRWKPFAEEKLKCERPAGESPVTVYSLAECEAKAENLGRKFLNFDAAKNLCFTSLTCNNQKRTLYKWQIFKLSDPAPVQSTVSQRNPAPSTTGWEQFAQPNLKCERPKGTPAKQRVANLAACESFASPSCTSPKAAHLPWTIYHRAARPRGLELVAILEPKMKCERPAG